MVNGINGHTNVAHEQHKVMDCIHEGQPQKSGGAGSPAERSGLDISLKETEAPQWNLFHWMGNLVSKGKNGLRDFWGSEDAVNTERPSMTGTDGAVTDGERLAEHTAKYFVPAMAEPQKQPGWFQNMREKTRIKFEEIRNALSKQFKNSQTLSAETKRDGRNLKKEEKNRSRESLYREDELEIACVITDDSYLLDSYNKKGTYSKLGIHK